MHSLAEQINAIQVISGKEVIAITVNHEGMEKDEILDVCKAITLETKLPAFDVLEYGAEDLIALLMPKIK
jgi:uncharacterized NAD-dependent epimerase/dehydratase family protein